jgi:hypothetical protein
MLWLHTVFLPDLAVLALATEATVGGVRQSLVSYPRRRRWGKSGQSSQSMLLVMILCYQVIECPPLFEHVGGEVP